MRARKRSSRFLPPRTALGRPSRSPPIGRPRSLRQGPRRPASSAFLDLRADHATCHGDSVAQTAHRQLRLGLGDAHKAPRTPPHGPQAARDRSRRPRQSRHPRPCLPHRLPLGLSFIADHPNASQSRLTWRRERGEARTRFAPSGNGSTPRRWAACPASQSWGCVTAPKVSRRSRSWDFSPMAAATFFTATIAWDLGIDNRSPTSANRSACRSPGVGLRQPVLCHACISPPCFVEAKGSRSPKRRSLR